jgi:hypothetical protein
MLDALLRGTAARLAGTDLLNVRASVPGLPDGAQDAALRADDG